ncbi:acyltransferase [uncultured Lactobacillus sp.]|uniref:acyltransferase family protein n=1 Tax=uncultured Lactobacillus sp. TaxID=153152 RepID=UPI00262A8DF3|nr:acyltransferase [uncultured Lactobacillus sp.]
MKVNQKTDIGDYLKVFACSAVISQPIMSKIMAHAQTQQTQDIFAVLYNLVKYTAPAFIFGILYTTIRIHRTQNSFSYPHYLKTNWRNLFIPTILWTSIYLLFMPYLQQKSHYHNLSTFCWQFINGNAAPHLWYNTMMLQFIILMPLFYKLSIYIGHNAQHAVISAILTFIVYFAWLAFYDYFIFHGPHQNDWYLSDRIFISFLIYAIYGVLAWNMRNFYNKFVLKYFWLIMIFLIICLIWTTSELERYGHPINFNNAPYYKPSMTFYCLAVICLVSAFYLYQLKNKKIKSLTSFHFLASYAYRAYLSNVFWLEIIWNIIRTKALISSYPVLCLLLTWILTWLASFSSAYLFHVLWLKSKSVFSK